MKGLGLALLCYVTGWLYVKFLVEKKYVTSFADEMNSPWALGSLKTLEDGRILVRSEFVLLIGGMFWFTIYLICVALYWGGVVDVVTPFREWLFETGNTDV